MRILNIVTADMSRVFFRGSLAVMNRSGFETALCSSPGERLNEVAAAEDSQITNIKAACKYSIVLTFLTFFTNVLTHVRSAYATSG